MSVGRTGVLIPNAMLEPVEIGGVVVERATLHNFDYIAEKDIRQGDRVLLKRAGEVIPYVIGPVVDARTGAEQPYVPPQTCPACGQPVEHLEGEVAWYCVNAACPAQLIRNVEHFVSRGAMEITGLGIKIVEKLIETGAVKDVADIYTLSRADILKAVTKQDRKTDKEPPGKIADNLLASIDGVEGTALEPADHCPGDPRRRRGGGWRPGPCLWRSGQFVARLRGGPSNRSKGSAPTSPSRSWTGSAATGTSLC